MSYPVPTIGANSVPASSALAQLATDVSFVLNGHITCSSAASSATLTLTTTPADVTGCSVSVSVTGTNAFALCLAVYDISKTAVNVNSIGLLNVDGSDQTDQAILGDSSSLSIRVTAAQHWRISLTAGSHTIKLRGYKDANVGTVNMNNPHTKLIVVVVDNQ